MADKRPVYVYTANDEDDNWIKVVEKMHAAQTGQPTDAELMAQMQHNESQDHTPRGPQDGRIS